VGKLRKKTLSIDKFFFDESTHKNEITDTSDQENAKRVMNEPSLSTDVRQAFKLLRFVHGVFYVGRDTHTILVQGKGDVGVIDSRAGPARTTISR
jgi:hypothetical protein